MSDDVRVVVSNDDDGNEVKVAVLKPKANHLREAQLAYNRAFRDALESGALLRQKLEDHMREQGIWDDTKQKQYDDVATMIKKERQIYKDKADGPVKDSQLPDVRRGIMAQAREQFKNRR